MKKMKIIILIVIFSGCILQFNVITAQNVFPDTGFVGIGVLNPQFELDINGNVRISSNLFVGGGIIISEKVNATKEVVTELLKSTAIRADSIIMDSTKAFYGESKFEGDVKLKYKLDVTGDVNVNGSIRTQGNITFGGNKTLGYLPASGGNPEIIYFSSHPEIPTLSPCFPSLTTPLSILQQEGIFQTFGVNADGNINKMSMGFNGTDAVIDIENEGINNITIEPKLLINYYCGKDVSINAGLQGGDIQLTSTGKVGVGTDNPQKKFHIYNLSNDVTEGTALRLQWAYSGMGIPSTTWDMQALTGKLLFKTPDYNASVLTLTKTGKAGIGTDNPMANFHIKGITDFGIFPEPLPGDEQSALSAVLRIEDNVINSTNNRNVSWDYTVSGFQQKMFISNNVSGATNYVMTFKENGDCGIGTTSPEVLLHLKGTLPQLRFEDGNSKKWNIDISNGCFNIAETGINNRIVIKEGGNVGIGTTTPVAKLSIEGYSINNAIVNIFDSRNPTENTGFNIFQIQKLFPDDITGNPPVRGTCFSIADTGNVSIGNSVHYSHPTPIQKLEVWGAIKVAAATTTPFPADGTIEYSNGNFFGYAVGVKKSLVSHWSESPTNPNNIFYNGGNVGIGTDIPQKKLHVFGDSFLEGKVNINTIDPNSDPNTKLYVGIPTGQSLNSGMVRFESAISNIKFCYYNSSLNESIGLHINNPNAGTGLVVEVPSANNAASFFGKVGIGTFTSVTDPQFVVKLTQDLLYYSKAASFNSFDDQGSVFIVPKLCDWGYNNLSKQGDQGIFWNDGLATSGKNLDAGFVIAPFTDSPNGIRITKDGDVGIGTNDIPAGYKLAVLGNANISGNVGIGTTQLDPNSILTVKGKIKASEIELVDLANIPDYVFEKDYSLMTLKELEDYITKNKHLPEVPSAVFVKNNGLQLGEFNTLLLKKIEELTLYLIQIEKDNIALKERIIKLENNK